MIKLGTKVKDPITGLTGIAVARTEWLYQCVRVGVQPEGLHDGEPIDLQWFDEPGLVVVKDAEKAKAKKIPDRTTGGPMRPVPPARDPK